MPCCRKKDVIAQAQSGTGKTATFSIAILQNLIVEQRECQALVLAPTRELAQQIQKVVMALGDYMSAHCHACIGGTNVRDDIRRLETGVHIVVGTPGRVYDMLQRRSLGKGKGIIFLIMIMSFFCFFGMLDPRNIKMFVLDEADEMLSRGFKDQIYDVFRLLPSDAQVSFS